MHKKKLLKVFIVFCIASLPLFGAIDKTYWKKNETIELSKDEFFKITFLVEGKVTKELYFRWTLYKNRALKMHLGYEGHVYQFVLHAEYGQDSWKLPIYGKPKTPEAEPYFMLSFKDFKLKTKTAVIEYFVRGGDLKLDITTKKIKDRVY